MHRGGSNLRRIMRRNIGYEMKKLGSLQVLRDFLPPAERLAFQEGNVKARLNLSELNVRNLAAFGKDDPT